MSKSTLFIHLLNHHLSTEPERMAMVRRQNEAAQNAAIDRWAVKNSSKKSLTPLLRGAKKSA